MPLIGGTMSDPTMTFRREDLYGSTLPSGSAVILDANILVYSTFDQSAFHEAAVLPLVR